MRLPQDFGALKRAAPAARPAWPPLGCSVFPSKQWEPWRRPQPRATYGGSWNKAQARAEIARLALPSLSQTLPGFSAPFVNSQLLSPLCGAAGREGACASQRTENGRNVGIIFHDHLH